MPFSRYLLLTLALFASFTASGQHNPVVVLETSAGGIEITLYPDKAPVTVANFLALVDAGHYDGTIFHRVIKGFMIQGGGLDRHMQRVPATDSIGNEADNGLQNLAGTIAMARTMEPHSASDQFFINVSDNPNLDHRSKSLYGWGYAVFGKVTAGMDVVQTIENVATTSRNGHDDVPVEAVVIESARRRN